MPDAFLQGRPMLFVPTEDAISTPVQLVHTLAMHVDRGFLNFLTYLGIGTMCDYDGDGRWLFQTVK